MAYEISNYAVKATFVAATDLSNSQYKFVEFAPLTFPEGTVMEATSAANTIGVLQNAPKAGQEAEVVLVGITKVKAADAISAGGRVTVINQTIGAGPATISGAATTTGQGWILGRALTTAAAGEIATVAISTPAANYFVD